MITRYYKVDVSNLFEFANVLSSLKNNMLPIFRQKYAVILGYYTSKLIDNHIVGMKDELYEKEESDSPMKSAYLIVKNLYNTNSDITKNLDMYARFYFYDDGCLCDIESDDIYKRHLNPDLFYPFDVEGVDGEERERRIQIWHDTRPSPRLGILKFSIIDGNLLSLRPHIIKKYVPSLEKRIAATARDLVGYKEGISGNELKSFLQKEYGKKFLEQEKRRISSLLPPVLDIEHFTSYPDTKPLKKKTVSPPILDEKSINEPINRADVIQSDNGTIVIAVDATGFMENERIHVQIADRTLSFVQSAKNYGEVIDCPGPAIDLLKGTKEAIVIEIGSDEEGKFVKARHMALITDSTLASKWSQNVNRWKNVAIKKSTT